MNQGIHYDAYYEKNGEFIKLEEQTFSGDYTVLLNLETGELKDVLAGTGVEKLMDLCNQAVAEDGSKMLLAQSSRALYCVDLSTKQLYSVEELSGETTDACSLIEDTLACWVLENDVYRVWTIDLSTLERREVFSGVQNIMGENYAAAGQSITGDVGLKEYLMRIVYPTGFDTTIYWGTMSTGSHFALETDEAGKQAM